MSKPKQLLERYAIYAVALTIGATLWQLISYKTNPAFLSSFTKTMAQIWEFILDGTLEAALLSSLGLFAAGMFFAVIVGLLLGLLLARVRLLRVALENYITILYATPMVALIPFILSTMGFGFAPKALVVFLFAFFPILYNTVEGARSIRPEMIEVAKSFRSSEWSLWCEVMIPYTLPYTMTGVRQSIGRALVGMVAAEFFLSSTGLGQLIMTASQNFDTGGVFASIFVIGMAGVGLMRVGLMIEQHFAKWRQ